MEKLINELADWLDENFVTLGSRPPGVLLDRLRQFADDVRLSHSLARGEHDHYTDNQLPTDNHTQSFDIPKRYAHMFHIPRTDND